MTIKNIGGLPKGWRLLYLAAPLMAWLPTMAPAAVAPPPFKFIPQTLSAEDLAAVKRTYAQACAACHGMTGGGMNNGLALYASNDALHNAGVIHFGATEPVVNGIEMPNFGEAEILTPKEVSQLAVYVTSFSPDWP